MATELTDDAASTSASPPLPDSSNLPNGTSNTDENTNNNNDSSTNQENNSENNNDENNNNTSNDTTTTTNDNEQNGNNELNSIEMEEPDNDANKTNKNKPTLGEIDENEETNTDNSNNNSIVDESNEDEKDNNNNDNNSNNSENTDTNNSNNNNSIIDKTNSFSDTASDGSIDSSTTSLGESEEDSLGSGTLGYDEEGKMLPAFENVDDELLSFNSESDFAIFQKQLNGDIPLQRLVAVKRMVAGCPHWGTEAALSLIPRFQSISNDKELVIRQTIAEQLGPFAKYLVEATNNSPKAHKIVINELLPLMKDMLRDAGEIRQGAGNSLIMIAELLTEVEVHEHVLKIVLHMAHDDSDDQKITALPLLADLAPIVGHSVCRNYLSSDLNALSQDNSFRVRKSTVQYFGPICEQLGADDVEKQLLPVFQQLCSDSIWSVRKGCVESFVDVANSVHQETRGKLIPIMEKFLNDSSRWVRNAAYEHLGPFLSVLTSEQIKPELVKYFVNIPHLSSAEADADCTNHCAFNFPAVAQTLGPDRWDELNDLYNILVRKTFKSRKTLACSIHEICKILGTDKTERYLMSAIEFFLKDIDDIREGIIKNLWKLLSVFTEARRQEYISQLWDLASESDVNWRFRLLLAQQLEEVIPLYTPKVVYEQFVPLTFQLCNDRMADVRYAAVDPVKDLINCFDKAQQRESLEGVIKKCHTIRDGKTYAKRLLFIRICEACFGKINKEIYDSKFFESVLKYQDDKIMNVRYCLSRFIKNKLVDHSEYKDLTTLKNAIDKLRNDPEDVEVRRFFATEDEIEKFLRSYKSSQPMVTQATNPQTLRGQDDMEESDSSLYSSSDDEMNPSSNQNGNANNNNDTSNDTITNNSNGITNNSNENENTSDSITSNDTTTADTSDSNKEEKADAEAEAEEVDDGSDDSFDDEAEHENDNLKDKEKAKLTKKLSAIDLETAKDDTNPEKATGAGPDIADIGPDGRLVHQPTPFRLDIPPDDEEEEEENNKNKDNKDKDTENKDSKDSDKTEDASNETNESKTDENNTDNSKDKDESNTENNNTENNNADSNEANGTYQNGIESEKEKNDESTKDATEAANPTEATTDASAESTEVVDAPVASES